MGMKQNSSTAQTVSHCMSSGNHPSQARRREMELLWCETRVSRISLGIGMDMLG